MLEAYNYTSQSIYTKGYKMAKANEMPQKHINI